MQSTARAMTEEPRSPGDRAGLTCAAFPSQQVANANDGKVRFGVGVVDVNVLIGFERPVYLVDLTKSQAYDLAKLLMKYSKVRR